MEHFTPGTSFLGGLLIGLAAAAMLYVVGRIAGISGIFGGLLNAERGDTAWRGMFVLGLIVGGILTHLVAPDSFQFNLDRSTPALIVGGLLVGIGARLGNGCTSGHGVCGVGRLAPRSIVAVFAFLSSAAVTAIVVNRVFGGAI